MKFDCGEDGLAQMERLKQWHPFYCLFPRRMTGTRDCRWLEVVERKGYFAHDYWIWSYRAIESPAL